MSLHERLLEGARNASVEPVSSPFRAPSQTPIQKPYDLFAEQVQGLYTMHTQTMPNRSYHAMAQDAYDRTRAKLIRAIVNVAHTTEAQEEEEE